MSKLQIKQIKSINGTTKHQRAVLRSLGLKRLHQTVVRENRAEFVGMINKVSHLIEVQQV